jgi:serine phosphatase RsbU (regulator of sigma subunit)
LEQERSIARQIQAGLLPGPIRHHGWNVVSTLRLANDVGADYCDVLSSSDGCWLGIGKVAGHGLHAGLMALMLHSMVSVLLHERSAAEPAEVLVALNERMYQTVRGRLDRREFATLTLLRCERDGRIVLSGAHQDPIIWRAREKRTEVVPVHGAWIAAVADIRRMTESTTLRLEPGDGIVLYTDGVVDALDGAGEPFGIERLALEVENALNDGHTDPAEVSERLFEKVSAWGVQQSDDRTIVVARFEPESS